MLDLQAVISELLNVKETTESSFDKQYQRFHYNISVFIIISVQI